MSEQPPTELRIDLGRAKLLLTLVIACGTLIMPALNVWLELRQLRVEVNEIRATLKADHETLVRIEERIRRNPQLTALP